MLLKFHNTISRSLEVFEPIDQSQVRMYTCGPTVYDFAHIGNLRAYVFEDLLRRTLEYAGYVVFHVMNLTDVDDKTIRNAHEQNVSLDEYTAPFKAAFFEDLKALNVFPAHKYPLATEHVGDMIRLIQRLFDRGFAYQSPDGSVYFPIEKCPEYGKLAHLDLSGLRPGARVDHDEYEKDHLGDFALWKAWVQEDGKVAWDSPWGKGRPGWHIECSAMSMRYLGESFDIHCGGVDNIFPHHEDEIAQSEAATGKPFCRYWMHNAHLVVDREKMSKSLGNFYTLRDLICKGYNGREVRYALMTNAHYRQTLNFMLSGLDAARAALQRLDAFRIRMKERIGDDSQPGPLPPWAATEHRRFQTSLGDDLNISQALAAVFAVVRTSNKQIDEGCMSTECASAIASLMADFDRVLGFLEIDEAENKPDQKINDLLQRRQEARAIKDWGESDRLREELLNLGWIVKDTPDGPKLMKA